jgi:hypothetical protein
LQLDKKVVSTSIVKSPGKETNKPKIRKKRSPKKIVVINKDVINNRPKIKPRKDLSNDLKFEKVVNTPKGTLSKIPDTNISVNPNKIVNVVKIKNESLNDPILSESKSFDDLTPNSRKKPKILSIDNDDFSSPATNTNAIDT